MGPVWYVPGAWARARQGKFPEEILWPASSVTNSLARDNRNETKKPNPTDQGLGKCMQRQFKVGGRKWIQGFCPELKQLAFY